MRRAFAVATGCENRQKVGRRFVNNYIKMWQVFGNANKKASPKARTQLVQ